MVSLRRPGLEVALRLVAVRSPAANGLNRIFKSQWAGFPGSAVTPVTMTGSLETVKAGCPTSTVLWNRFQGLPSDGSPVPPKLQCFLARKGVGVETHDRLDASLYSDFRVTKEALTASQVETAE